MYKILTDDQAQEQVDALPAEALSAYAEVCVTLEVAPWNGEPYNHAKPESPMRAISFGPEGQGDLVYLIVEHERRVDILTLVWLDLSHG